MVDKGSSRENIERSIEDKGRPGENTEGFGKDTGGSKEMGEIWGYSTMEICCPKKF
jgi:hypothetical protein